jgi:hypothetical protein
MDVAFHAEHFGDLGDAARTVAQARAWMMTSTASDDHFANGLRDGSEKPPMVIIDSRRLRASRGVLACSVPIEPSWPVFMACSRSNASGRGLRRR